MKKRYFHAEKPEMLGLDKGSMEIGGLEELRDILKPCDLLETVYIDRQKHFGPVLGEFYNVVGIIQHSFISDTKLVLGIVNFYEE